MSQISPNSPINVRIFPVTPFKQNCSLVWDSDTMEGVFVDPGGDFEMLLAAAKDLGVSVKEIWLTHGHLDHAGGAEDIRAKLGIATIGPHKEDQFWLDLIEESWAKYGQPGLGKNTVPDRYLEEGETLNIGKTEFNVVHTPGHTPGHVVIYNQDLKIAFVGDVLFKGSVGRTDFPKSDPQALIDSIKTKLWPLGDDMRFVSGHGLMSTFGAERQSNPFVGDHVTSLHGRSSGIM